MYYSAQDSFRRLLDLSTCIEATVESQNITIVPPTCLEDMIIKEHSNEKLTMYTPPLASFLKSSDLCYQDIDMASIPSDEVYFQVNNKIYTSTNLLENMKINEADNIILDIKFSCSSRFILMVCMCINCTFLFMT